MHILPIILIGVGLFVLILALRVWQRQSPARLRCGDCSQCKGVAVYVKRTEPHQETSITLCPACADRRYRMGQTLTHDSSLLLIPGMGGSFPHPVE